MQPIFEVGFWGCARAWPLWADGLPSFTPNFSQRQFEVAEKESEQWKVKENRHSSPNRALSLSLTRSVFFLQVLVWAEDEKESGEVEGVGANL